MPEPDQLIEIKQRLAGEWNATMAFIHAPDDMEWLVAELDQSRTEATYWKQYSAEATKQIAELRVEIDRRQAWAAAWKAMAKQRRSDFAELDEWAEGLQQMIETLLAENQQLQAALEKIVNCDPAAWQTDTDRVDAADMMRHAARSALEQAE